MKTALCRSRLLVCLLAVSGGPLAAQVDWDNSGNNLLQGDYYFREVIWQTDGEGSDALAQGVTQYGVITFDGAGNYDIRETINDSLSGQFENISVNGTYSIGANGFGFLDREGGDGGVLYGGVAQGVFIASSTESAINNLFLATQVSGNPLTTADFNHPYTVAYVNLSTLVLSDVRDAFYELDPDGLGGLGPVELTGFIAGNREAQPQTINNAIYSFSDGVGALNFGGEPGASVLLSGEQELYISPGGELIFGGSRDGFDMFVGVRTPLDTVASDTLSGLYFQAGVDVDRNDPVSAPPRLDCYYGAFTANSGTTIGHQRLLVAPLVDAFDFLYSDEYTLRSDGTHDDFLGYHYIVDETGYFRIGYGEGDFLGINIAVGLPDVEGPGAFISPYGVVNAASFTPFTSGIAPGTFVTLFGTGFASENHVDTTFPTTLGGVQILVNGRAAPLLAVTPFQISLVVPFDTEFPIVEFQITRDGVPGNRVTAFVNTASPGIFTVPPVGTGFAAALHPDFSLVTPQSPAQPNEVIAVYLTGLGEVNPAVPTGTAGPRDPLSRITGGLAALIGGADSEVIYAGLAPDLVGLYQINVRIPATLPPGIAFLELSTFDAFSSQVILPIGSGASSERSAAAIDPASRRRASYPHQHPASSQRPGAARTRSLLR